MSVAQPATQLAQSRYNLRLAIGIGLGVKALVSVGILVSFLQSDFANIPNLWNRFYVGTLNLTAWWIPFTNWDGQHYLLLSGGQWSGLENSWQFFPLYPFCIFLLAHLMPGWAAGLLLNCAFTVGFCFYLCKLGEHFQCRTPQLAVLLLMCFPSAFFTSVVYGEALFLFLLLGFVYCLLCRQTPLTWLYLFLMPLARGTSVFVFGGFLLYSAYQLFAHRTASPPRQGRQTRKQRRRLRHTQNQIKVPAFDWRLALGCGIAFALGITAYLAFFAWIAGDPTAGLTAQDRIGAENKITNLFNPMVFIGNLTRPTLGVFKSHYALVDRVVLAAMLLGLALFVLRRQWVLLCFYFPLMYAHAAMGVGAQSYARYALMAAPFVALALTQWLKSMPLVALCAGLFAVQVWWLHNFALNYWVG